MDLAWHTGMSWIQVGALALQESAHPPTVEYRETTFRAVAGLHFEAVEEQAGSSKTLVNTYLLY